MSIVRRFKFTILFVAIMTTAGTWRVASGHHAWQGIPALVFAGVIVGAALGYQRGHRDGMKDLIAEVKRQRLGGP